MENFLSIPRLKIEHAHDVFISFTMIETLHYVQFYPQCNTRRSFLRISDTLGLVLLLAAQSIDVKLRGSRRSSELWQPDTETPSAQ